MTMDTLDRDMEAGLRAMIPTDWETPDGEKGERVLGRGMADLRRERGAADAPHYVEREALRQSGFRHSRSALVPHLPEWIHPRIESIGEPRADGNPWHERQNCGAVLALIDVAMKDCDLSDEARAYLRSHQNWERALSAAFGRAIAHLNRKEMY